MEDFVQLLDDRHRHVVLDGDAMHGPAGGESLLDDLKRRRGLWLAIFGTFCMCAFSSYAVLSWIPTFFARKYGLPPASAGVLIGSVIMPGGILGCLVSGVLSDWLKRRGTSGSRMLVFVFSWFVTIPCIAALPFLADYRMADGEEDYAFVHVTFKIGAGRTEAQKTKVCDELFAMMKAHFAGLFAKRYLALSMELHEFDEGGTYKYNNVHAKFRQVAGSSSPA